MSDISFDVLDHYQIENREGVEAFLTQHPPLNTVLYEAYQQIEQVFELYPLVLLGVDTDQEDSRLVATVITDFTPKEAVSCLNELDLWQIRNYKNMVGLLSFDIGYK